MLKLAKIVLIHRQRIAQDRRRILYGIALRQVCPYRFGKPEAKGGEPGEKQSGQTAVSQGELKVLSGLWHSRMIH